MKASTSNAVLTDDLSLSGWVVLVAILAGCAIAQDTTAPPVNPVSTTVEIGGQRMQSVSGGAHWGGGMFIPTTDHARIGLLMLNRGRWGDRQLVSRAWIERSRVPGSANPGYGNLFHPYPSKNGYILLFHSFLMCGSVRFVHYKNGLQQYQRHCDRSFLFAFEHWR